MSTVTENAAADPTSSLWSQPSVAEKPRLAVTCRITDIKDAKTTGDGEGDYERAEIIVESTNGSRKFFPSIMFRNEMFSVGHFDVKRSYEDNPALRGVAPGKKRTTGEIWSIVYGMNCFPRIKKGKEGAYADRCTPLMALCGGTLEGLTGFAKVLQGALATPEVAKRRGDFGFPELTSEEIVALLRDYHKSLPPYELAAVLKQGNDASGDLSDKYEVDTWVGPFNAETHERLLARATKNAGNPDVTKRLVIGYGV